MSKKRVSVVNHTEQSDTLPERSQEVPIFGKHHRGWSGCFVAAVLCSSWCYSGELRFPDGLRDKKGSALFESLLSDPGNQDTRLSLVEYFRANRLWVEFNLFNRTVEISSAENFDFGSENSQETDRIQYSILCSYFTGIPRDEERELQNRFRREAQNLAENSRQSPCESQATPEQAIEDIGYGCPLVVEWAYATLACSARRSGEMVRQDREAAIRALVELESRGFLPVELPTSTDLYFFLSRTFFRIGDIPTAIVLGEMSLEKYPQANGMAAIAELTPTVSRNEINKHINDMRSCNP